MKVSEAVARAVVAEVGQTPIFALIGDANLRPVGSLDRDAKANLWFARDEGAAVAMADGYAQASNSLGVTSVTSGPGLTHAATSLLGASRMHTPLVVLAGDTPMRGATGLQAMMKIDQRRFAEACEAGFHDLRSPATLSDDIAAAFAAARAERRPIVLNVPLDLQTMDVADGWAPTRAAKAAVKAKAPSRKIVSEIVALIASCRRPLIVAGRGARWADARAAIEGLADRIGSLLGTTLLAKGFFHGNPWNIGVIGGYSKPAGMDLIREADLVLAFGAELGHFTTQANSLFEGRTVVRIDAAPASGSLPPHAAFQGDAREMASALAGSLSGDPAEGYRTPDIAKRLAAAIVDDPPTVDDGLLDPRALMRDLSAALPAGADVVVGGGHFWSFPCLYLDPPAGGKYLCPLGAAAVGQALPFAIGVASAAPGRPVIAVEGDGSLLMNIQELDTAARHKLPLALVIMNDGALSAEAIRLGMEGYDSEIAAYPSPDFAAVARGFGWRAETIRAGADIGALVRGHRWRDGPLLIDARISRTVMIDPVSVKDLSRKR